MFSGKKNAGDNMVEDPNQFYDQKGLLCNKNYVMLVQTWMIIKFLTKFL